jgi:3-isopropylmalate/(R)-2-methylmalate dehydratase small subunit
MEPLRHIAGVACPIALANVDTDQILPARFLQRPRSEGHGPVLFHDMRFDAAGKPRPEFPLNRPAWTGARILVARRNFGAGSSRESAVWGMLANNIRCIVARSFSDIYRENCLQNGLLPVTLRPEDAEAFEKRVVAVNGAAAFTVDLQTQTISGPGGPEITFDISAADRMRLLEGLDDIGLSLKHTDEIVAWEKRMAAAQPWLQTASDSRVA